MQSTGSEIWKPVPEYEGLYEVSDHGRVRSLPRRGSGNRANRVYGGTVLRPARTNKSGHVSVVLSRANRHRTVLVHRLVLEAFAGAAGPGEEACHFDGDATNNALTNLRWDTRAENTRDRVRHGTHQMSNRTHCPYGHEYAPWNLDAYTLKLGKRRCLACTRARRWGGKRGLPFDPKKADEIYSGLAAR